MKAWQVLAIGGAAGMLSLLALPVEQLAPDTGLPPLALRALTLIQPAILLALAIWAGTALAGRTGLRAPLAEAIAERRGIGAVLKRQLPPALLVGALCAAVLLAYGHITAPFFTQPGAMAERMAAFTLPLVTRLLYGGIVEELIVRWGLMSLFAWALWRVSGRPASVPGWIYWAAIAVAAALFAAGHLPLLLAIDAAPPAWLVRAAMLGNLIPGLLFGWLYWRRGLEAAMIAHALAHLLAWAAS